MNVLIDLDEETLRRLEAVAPAKSRKRSTFIRAAIQKSLWELEEDRTRQAYLADPDQEPPAFEPAAWDALPYGGFDPPARSRTARAPTTAAPKTRKRKARAVRRAAGR